MKVSIIYLAEPKYGGWPTFTAHLCHGLHDAGHAASLYKIGNNTEKKTRPFGRGIRYQNISISVAERLASTTPTLIAAASPKHGEKVLSILAAGASIVIHDPTELKGEMKDALAATHKPVIVIRKSNLGMIEELGLKAHYIPHPYKRFSPSCVKLVNAVSISRLDFDKHIDIICQANLELPKDRQVSIYGALNRLYAFHKLDKAVPEWKNWYKGGFDDTLVSGPQLASTAKYVVDMSQIKGDGGGTQYTFLEAWDAGARLVLHRGWLTGDPDKDEVAETARFVSDPGELAGVLRDDKFFVDTSVDESVASVFAMHDARVIAEQYIVALGG